VLLAAHVAFAEFLENLVVRNRLTDEGGHGAFSPMGKVESLLQPRGSSGWALERKNWSMAAAQRLRGKFCHFGGNMHQRESVLSIRQMLKVLQVMKQPPACPGAGPYLHT
jgi:hypothetical protein